MAKKNIPKKKFYISTAIHYSSGLPHIGHAYENIFCDVIARYKRYLGYDVFFSTGLDEHGQKIFEKATEAKKTPNIWIGEICGKFMQLWKRLGISYDGFIRTSSQDHIHAVQKAYMDLFKTDNIYLGQWNTLYCVQCETAYTESEVVIENDKKCCNFHHQLVEKSEPSYFFKMSSYNEWITDFLNINKELLIPHSRLNELTNTFLKNSITDLSISRPIQSCAWGIPVPNDKKHVIYVWLDALLNYVTVLGYNSKSQTKFKKFWQDKNSEIVHVVGKDIMRFHAIYWPIFLNCLKLRQPNHIIGHGFILDAEGKKMSKSLGNVVDPNDLINQFGIDAVRYFFLREFLPVNDNKLSIESLKECYNNDLANNFGNLISRFIGIFNRCPATFSINKPNTLVYDDNTKKLISIIETNVNNISDDINKFEIQQAILKIVEIGKACNKYIEDIKPWELIANNDIANLNIFMYFLANGIRIVLSLLQPLLINGCPEMIKVMKFKKNQLDFANLLKFDLISKYKPNKTVKAIYERIK